jgi:hypothetical protein
MTKRANLYLGKAGQMLVMAEFLERGWNVGAPEVDVGDDVFVVRDTDGDLSRIQVKTARATQHNYGYSGQFFVQSAQLNTLREPPLDYIFTIRLADDWGPFVVMRQTELQAYVANQDIGSQTTNGRNYRLRYEIEEGELQNVECSGFDLSDHVDNFSNWERINH